MSSARVIERWSQRVLPPPSALDDLEFYLHRATLFWNMCVDNLQGPIKTYMDSESPDARVEFSQQTSKFFEYVLGLAKNKPFEPMFFSDGVPITVMESWLAYIPEIFELPEAILRHRFIDFVKSCVTAKRSVETKKDELIAPPRCKTNFSTQTIRLTSSDFELSNGVLKINGPREVTLKLPKSETIAFPAPYSVSITRRKQSTRGRAIGPPSASNAPYYLVTIYPAHA